MTNEEMKDTVESQELQECNNLCQVGQTAEYDKTVLISVNLESQRFSPPCFQNLQVKMRGRGFPWSKLLMVLLVFAAGFITHDIRSHGSFAGVPISHSHTQ